MKSKVLLLLSFCFLVFVNLIILWLLGSFITSALKSAKSECGYRYRIEAVFDGNFFCSAGGRDDG